VNVIRDAAYWARRALLGIYGPGAQDPKSDPVEQLKRDHSDKVVADGDPPPAENVEPAVDDAAAAGWEQGRANAGEPPD